MEHVSTRSNISHSICLWFCHFNPNDNVWDVTQRRLPPMDFLSFCRLGVIFKNPCPPLPHSLVRDCVNMRECGGGWCVLVTQPVPCKRIHRSTNRSFLLQLQAGIQIVWGVTASYQSYYLKRTVYCVRWIRLKIVELDGSFKLIRIFQQQQLWWISRLNTDVSLHYVWEEEHHEAPDCISSNIPLVPMNIDPCTSKVKVDTTKSAEWAAVFLAHYFLVFLTI